MHCPNCEQEVCECGPFVMDFRTWTFRPKHASIRPQALRVNIIGDGSAGQRHARMLRERGCTVQVYGEKHQSYCNADAVVIASPPDTHSHLIRMFCNVPMLCEGPVTALPTSHNAEMLARMTAENWLFVPEVQSLVSKCRNPFVHPTHAHLYFDYDLELWRGKGWDYKSSCYYTSGIDNINVHEVMVALALFGPAEDARVFKRHTGKSKAYDSLVLTIDHKSGVLCTINSSWHSAVYRRGVQVYYEDGSMDELSWTSPGDDSIANASYGRMLDHWLECIRTGAAPTPSLYDGYSAYKLLNGECV